MSPTSRVTVRRAVAGDAASLVAVRRGLFAETSLLLWEPAEFTSGAEDEARLIERFSERTNSLLLVALVDGHIVGFLSATGGERNRLRHSALVALGVLRAYWSRGAGSALLGNVIAWAPGAGIKRLELTVHVSNERAFRLYRRHGFEVEGTRRCSLRVDGTYVDEYLMSLITDIQAPAPPADRPHSGVD
jgi:RimJ/RimL family protein N-acetyltransferase